jgi:hypothetical protein
MSWTITPQQRFTPAALLDRFPGAAAAYSLRNLVGTSNPNVVRVRRSSDNTEQDFTAAQVTDGTLTTFCGAGDGFVRTWYDQSGNGRNATQITTGNQPQIVSNGTLLTEGSRPTLSFIAASNTYLTANSLASVYAGVNQPLSSFAVLKGARTNVTEEIYAFGTTASGIGRFILNRRNLTGQHRASTNDGTTTVNLLSGTTNTDTYLRSDIRPGSTLSTFVNGTVLADINAASFSVGSVSLNEFDIGNWAQGGYITPFDGRFFELIFYPSSQLANRTPIESNINAHYAIY